MQITAQQLASLAGGRVEGRGDVLLGNVAKIEEAREGDVTFLANPKYEPQVYTTGASAILVSDDFTPERAVNATLIRVADPYATLADLLTQVSRLTGPQPRQGVEGPSHIGEGTQVPDDAYVGAFAYVGADVTLGAGVQIFPQTYIGDGCTIGAGTVVKPGVKIYHGCVIGARCIIHAGAVIGADGFGFAPLADGTYEKIPQIGNVVIEDDVEIGANTCVDRATMGSTVISRGVKLDNLIQVAHNVEVGSDTVMAAQVGVAGSAKIGSRCMIGGQAGLAGHMRLGDEVKVGAQSGLHGNIPSGSTVIGSPQMAAAQFPRQVVYLKNLASLYGRVADLEKALKNKE